MLIDGAHTRWSCIWVVGLLTDRLWPCKEGSMPTGYPMTQRFIVWILHDDNDLMLRRHYFCQRVGEPSDCLGGRTMTSFSEPPHHNGQSAERHQNAGVHPPCTGFWLSAHANASSKPNRWRSTDTAGDNHRHSCPRSDLAHVPLRKRAGWLLHSTRLLHPSFEE